jgi:hypothetical protein
MEELRRRNIIRTSNNPVADYAEKVAVERLGLKQVGKEQKGFDAVDAQGYRYQIKGRRITKHNSSRQLSVIRNLNERLFDYLIAVIFDEFFEIKEIWKIPYEFVKERSRLSEHQNGCVFRSNRPRVRSESGRLFGENGHLLGGAGLMVV